MSSETRGRLKNRTQVTNTLNKKIYAMLKDYSMDSNVPISRLMDEAMELLLEKKGYNRALTDEQVEEILKLRMYSS